MPEIQVPNSTQVIVHDYPTMLQAAPAFAFLAEMWRSPVAVLEVDAVGIAINKHSWRVGVQFHYAIKRTSGVRTNVSFTAQGLCACFQMMSALDIVSTYTYNVMRSTLTENARDLISMRDDDGFLWPRSREGANARSRFCLSMSQRTDLEAEFKKRTDLLLAQAKAIAEGWLNTSESAGLGNAT